MSPETKRCSACSVEKSTEEFRKEKRTSIGLQSRCRECERRYYYENKERILAAQKAYNTRNSKKITERQAAWYIKNKEKCLRKNRLYYETNKDAVLATCKAWVDRNKDRTVQYKRRYAERHAEALRDRAKQWREDNAEHLKESKKAYYESKRAHYIAKAKEWKNRHPERAKEQRRQWTAANRGKVKAFAAAYEFRRRSLLAQVRNDLMSEQWEAIRRMYKYRCAYCGRKKPLTQDHITPVSKGGEHTLTNIVPACRSCNSSKNAGKPPIPVQPMLLTV